MASATDCADCGEPDALLLREYTDRETGACGDLYLCPKCADIREGIQPVDEQVMAGDGEGRR